MKRLLPVALFALAILVGGSVATDLRGHVTMGIPAPAATLTPPATTPTPNATPSNSPGVDFGLPAGYPNTYYNAFVLNSVGASAAVINLAAVPGQTCDVSVFGTWAGIIAVTQANTFANLQTGTKITGWIIANGLYTFALNNNTMIQFDMLTATSGSAIVAPNCHGGTVLYGSTLLK